MDDITIVIAVVCAESIDESVVGSPNAYRVRKVDNSMASMDSEAGMTTDESVEGYSPEKALRRFLTGSTCSDFEDVDIDEFDGDDAAMDTM